MYIWLILSFVTVNLELVAAATFINLEVIAVEKVAVSMTAEKMRVVIADSEFLGK